MRPSAPGVNTAAADTAGPKIRAGNEARYLILLFAETSEARNPRRQELIAKVLDDLARLCD
jgi:hypothetical protein